MKQLLRMKLIKAGYGRCITEMRLYYKAIDENIIVVGVHVDDPLITKTNAELIQDFFKTLSFLSIKQLGECASTLFSEVDTS